MEKYIKAGALIADLLSYAEANKGTYHEEGFKNAITVVEDQPPADVVDKDRYANLLANSIIVCEALKKYQSADNENIASRIRKEAYEQGYQDGKVDGYNLINEQIDLDEIAEAHERIGYDRGFRDGYAQAMEEAVRAVGRDTWAGSRLLKLQHAKFNERSEDGTN